MTSKHTVSLSRAHKLAERLTRHIDKISAEMDKMSRYVTAQVPAQVELASIRAQSIEALYGEQEECWTSLIAIRQAISEENEKAGIHSRLSAYKAQHRKLMALEHLLETFSHFRNGVEMIDAIDILKQVDNGVPSVNINVINCTLTSKLRNDIQLLRNAVDKLGDEVNDLNASKKVALDLSERVANIVGL